MEDLKKGREDYIDNVEKGMLIAFTNEEKMLAAMVKEIKKEDGIVSEVKVMTKNGSVYHVKKENIVWVKTGSRWPAGVFNALKESR